MKSQQGTACNRFSFNNKYNVVLLTFVLRNVLSVVYCCWMFFIFMFSTLSTLVLIVHSLDSVADTGQHFVWNSVNSI